jgi:hypothetical protein
MNHPDEMCSLSSGEVPEEEQDNTCSVIRFDPARSTAVEGESFHPLQADHQGIWWSDGRDALVNRK